MKKQPAHIEAKDRRVILFGLPIWPPKHLLAIIRRRMHLDLLDMYPPKNS